MRGGGLFALILSISVAKSFCQSAPGIQWQKDFGGSSTEGLFSVVETRDSGYLLGGYSSSGIGGDKTDSSFGGADYWIVKIDANGNKIWDKTYGGDSTDYLQKVVPTHDGGYLLAGYSNSPISGDKTATGYGYWEAWIVKIDSDGNKLWDKSYGGSGDNDDGLVSAMQTTDDGFLLWMVSSSDSNGIKNVNSFGSADYWLVKTDSVGNIQWQTDMGGSNVDHILSVIQTNDGGYAVGGFSMSGADGDKTTQNYGMFDYWVVKLDASRNIQWQQEYGGDSFDELMSLQQLPDSGYMIGGFSSSGISGNKTETACGAADYWMIRTDSKGNIQWQKVFGGDQEDEMRGGIMPTKDGGYLLVGFSLSGESCQKSESCRGLNDYWIVKTDALGNKEWDKTFGGDSTEYLSSAIQTNDGGFLLAGWSESGISGDKTDPTKGGFDYWVVKTTPDVSSVVTPVMQQATVTVFPNPFSDKATIRLNLLPGQLKNGLTLTITGSDGKIVKTFTNITDTEFIIEGSMLKDGGIYFYRLSDNETVLATGKIAFINK